MTQYAIRNTQYAFLIPLSLGLCLFALYLLSYRGGFHSVDEVSTFAVTESLVKFGQFNTDQIAWTQWVTTQAEAQGFFGQDGHVYSKKGLAISLAQAPLYWLALATPGLGMLQTVSLLNAILTAWTAILIYAILRRLGFSIPGAVVTALLYGTATLAWVYAKYLFSGTLAGFLLLLTFYWLLAYRDQGGLWRAGLAGFCGGLTVLARANNLILLAIFGLYLLWILIKNPPTPLQRLLKKSSVEFCSGFRPPSVPPARGEGGLFPSQREGLGEGEIHQMPPRFDFLSTSLRAIGKSTIPLITFAAGAALAGALFAWYNWLRSGNPLQTGYDLSIFSPNIMLGMYKLLFSPLRGLFVYSPVLLLAIPGWFQFRKRHAPEAWLILGLVSITALLFSAWTSGEGLSWGSRFLVPIVPFLMLALAPLIERFSTYPRLGRMTIAGLCGLSIAIQIIGVAINPWVYLGELQSQFGGAFFLERTAALTDFSTNQIVGQLRNWGVTNSDLIWWQPGDFDGLAFALSLGLLLLTAWFLWQTTHYAPRTMHYALRTTLLALLITVALTLFLLTHYHHSDPRQFGEPDAPYLQALDQAAEQVNGSEKIVTVAQYDYHLPMNDFKARVPILGFAQNEEPLPATAYPLLEGAMAGDAANIWLVTVGRQPAEPSNRVEAWLSQKSFKASDIWFDQTRLIQYGLAQPATVFEVNEIFGDLVGLQSAEYPPTVKAGVILPLTFHWQVTQPPAADYTIFVQLIDINGRLAAQHDGLPQGGYHPTSRWQEAEIIVDRHGLLLPETLPPGDYRLIVGLYSPADGVRLATASGADFVDLGIVAVHDE